MILDIGDPIKVVTSVPFKNPEGTPADPGTVIFYVKTPSGVTTTHEYGVDLNVLNPSTGVYEMAVDMSEDGEWQFRIEGLTGADFRGADEDRLIVRVSKFKS